MKMKKKHLLYAWLDVANPEHEASSNSHILIGQDASWIWEAEIEVAEDNGLFYRVTTLAAETERYLRRPLVSGKKDGCMTCLHGSAEGITGFPTCSIPVPFWGIESKTLRDIRNLPADCPAWVETP